METLQMHPADNVGLAVVDLHAGQLIELAGRRIEMVGAVPFGHKFALAPIARGDLVYKYGQPIGRAVDAIAPGEHVHVHNVESLRGRGDAGALELPPPPAPQHDFVWKAKAAAGGLSASTFMGYRRKDGRVGVRNHVLVLSTVQCANSVVDRIGQTLPEVVAVSHPWGCSQLGGDLEQTRRVLYEFARHPNVGAVLLVNLGCESMHSVEMAEQLAAEGVICQRVGIQDFGGARNSYARGLSVARELLQEVASARRGPAPLSELIVGLECGGSDAWSGVTANPAVGVASDLVVSGGGSVILSETPEIMGAEHLMSARALRPEVGQAIVDAVLRHEAASMAMGVDLRGAQPTPGNIEGGLTTIEEKSLGAITKGGTTPVVEYVGYACRATQRGLIVMDTPGNDPESVTGMVAGGAQVVVFTTGRGTPTGNPIAPVVKVATNTAMYSRLAEDMDVNAGTIISEGDSLAAVGQRIFDEVIAAANGKQTAAELWGAREFAITMIGPRQ